MAKDIDQVREDLSTFNFVQKYARYIPSKKRRETWEEACDRVLKMHLTKYKDKGPLVENMLRLASELERKKRILSSQRARQFGGEPTLKKNWRIYNCTTSYCDRPRFFQEAFWLLLCGCGVGFSIQKHHVNQLPNLLSLDDWKALDVYTHNIPDTIEGWADALGLLLSSRFGLTDKRPVFNYDLVRKAGSPISIGGKAPGPEPLRVCLSRVEDLLSKCESRLRPIDCFDIVMYASDAVLSGGVRRAASIALFSPSDHEMAQSKTGNWYEENPQRARANISVVITPDVDRSIYEQTFKQCKEFGEPGFIFASSTEHVYNPCVEIGMAPVLIKDNYGEIVQEYTIHMLENRDEYIRKGYTYESGWQACNLTEVNCAKFTTQGEALNAIRGATILGTAQAGYTDSAYLLPVSKQILEREALIGVSLTGMANNAELAFNPEFLRLAAKEVVKLNEDFAKMIGINSASRTTCVKPSGNAAVLLGCASGVHPEYAHRYIRRIQVSKTHPVAEFFAKIMPSAVQRSVWSAPGVEDVVISFPIENKSKALYRKELSAYEFISRVITVQQNWVQHGVARQSVQGLCHNVSNTILVQSDEWDEVRDLIWEKRRYLTGVSLLGAFGDYVYDQPPFQEIYTPDQLSLGDEGYQKKLDAYRYWESLRKSWKSPKYKKLLEKEDLTVPQQEVACTGGACEFKIDM